jgi:hypothetical protein
MRVVPLPPVFNRHGRRLESVSDWGKYAPPASPQHWKDGRSAKELAKSWISGSALNALTELFESRLETAGLVVESAVAEAQVAFDSHPGGRRNHDLLIHGRVPSGPIVIGLEAKADETFGETVRAYEARALKTRNSGATTNAPERLDELMDGIAATTLRATPAFGDLRFQLFSGVAGTLAAARSGHLAAFVVHEFATDLTTPAKRQANKRALEEFVGDVTGAVAPASDQWLLGPFHVPAERWSRTPLFIGHLTTHGTPTEPRSARP